MSACKRCGQEFQVTHFRKQYCGIECSNKDKQSQVPRVRKTHQCPICAASFTAIPSVRRKYCSQQCAGKALRKRPEQIRSRYRAIWIPGHPLADNRGLVKRNRAILYEKIGSDSHPCFWCGKVVTWMARTSLTDAYLVADHLDGDTHNDDPTNLVAACNTCNSKRTCRIKEDETYVVLKSGKKLRGVEKQCIYCACEFVVANSKSEQIFCSRPCFIGYQRQSSKGNKFMEVNYATRYGRS